MVESGARCKARNNGCDENHAKHYCRVCESSDSDHLAMNCPKGTTLYHGTRVTSISPISLTGLKGSSSGRLGPGLYLTTKAEAFKIAEHYGVGTGVAVFEVRVNISSCKDLGSAGDTGGSWMSGYNSATSMHPPWAGIPVPFREWVIKDPTKCRIKGLHMIGGVIDGEVRLPRATIRIQGTCRFGGNITAGNIILG